VSNNGGLFVMTSPKSSEESMLHVDLVRNDFGARQQRYLGRVSSVGDGVKIECDDANIERILSGPLHDPRTGHTIHHDQGDDYLAVLSRAWDGTYVLASAVHDDASCPFAHTLAVPMVGDTAL
jgi:hypothetical protein